MIPIILVCAFLALNAAAIGYFLTRAGLEVRQRRTFAAVAVAAVAIKIILAAQGHNYDLDSYRIVASLVEDGKSVYANTSRYNYAPLWAYLLAGLKSISEPFSSPESFHVAVAAFLAVVDVTMAAALGFAYSYKAALAYLASPVMLLLTGHHSQFDNFALLLGLGSWLVIRKAPATPRRLALAGLLAGVSLIVKHILFLFPLWVLLWRKAGRLRDRVAYVLIAYGLFGVSFLPWATDAASREGIIRNVFRYRSSLHFSALHIFINGPHPPSPAETSVLTLGWMAVLAVAGILIARRRFDLFPLYLLVMFALSPALADQYLAIAVLACAILYAWWPGWAFACAATIALLTSASNIMQMPANPVFFSCMPATQICAAALFIARCRTASPLANPAAAVIRAATLLMGSVGSMLLATALH